MIDLSIIKQMGIVNEFLEGIATSPNKYIYGELEIREHIEKKSYFQKIIV
ncbi:MAG: hypothetical protein HeimC3_33280 [Candidatus Heimdallarchaeota archaeon LC_3]|nr:MAG: hypothetical protein HeimC3_33280 [Candidatus Heimdallarchaeota archaeon LC_3]